MNNGSVSAVGVMLGFRDRLQLLDELLFSIYFPFLLVSAHERGPGGRWAVESVHCAVSHGLLSNNVGIEDERIFFADFTVLWASAVFLFLLVRLTAFWQPFRILLRFITGATAILGYPLVAIYTRASVTPFLYIELMIATICVLLWMSGRWPVSIHVDVTLLAFHFIFWSTLGGGDTLVQAAWTAIWPPLYLKPGSGGPLLNHVWLCYPLLGFFSTLIWAMHFKQSAYN